MGRVFLAEHVFMDRRVAIKVLHPELTAVPEYVQRFEREAKAAASIAHPHVAQALDFGRLPDQSLYLVLEHVEGRSLSALIAQGPVAAPRAARIALQIAEAMEQAHEKHIVHRDLKPENVLLLEQAEGADFVKVLDFGIAKIDLPSEEQGRALTQVGRVYGTPGYMAPEQGLGQDVDARADIYALGVLLYEMLCGRPPFEGAPAQILGQQLTRPLPFLAQKNALARVPAALERLTREMLSLDREQRPRSMSLVVERLEGLLRNRSLEGEHFECLGPRTGATVAAQKSAPRRVPLPKTSWPVPAKATSAILGFALLGALVSVGLVLTLDEARNARSPAAGESNESETTARAPVAPSEPSFAEELAQAKSLGRAGLVSLTQKHPAEPEAHAELSLASAVEQKYEAAVDEARVALALDPSLCRSPSLRGALYRAAQSAHADDAAFRLLLGPMGAEGAEVLFDLWHGEGVSEKTRARAKRELTSEVGRSLASPALQVATELELARSCKSLLGLLDRLRQNGDRRSLPRLEQLIHNETCSHRGEPCYPCLRGVPKLEEARLAIEQRELLKRFDGADRPR